MLVENLSKRVNNLDFFDLVLMALASFSLGLLIVRLVPELIDTSPWWWGALAIFFAVRPKFRFWIKKPS